MTNAGVLLAGCAELSPALALALKISTGVRWLANANGVLVPGVNQSVATPTKAGTNGNANAFAQENGAPGG